MQRLRPLSEEECYLRCYGWRGSEDAVKVRPGRRRARVDRGADRADPARVRGAPRRARARSGIAPDRHALCRPRRARPRAAPPSAVPDVLAPGLAVVFCGINPGRFSDAAAAHFANPRNDFWRLLHAAGLHAAPARPVRAVRRCSRSGSASRTPPTGRRAGSGDLRAGDFAGSAERLEGLARELRPGVIALRRQGGLPRPVPRAPGARPPGADGSARRRSSCSRRPRRRTPPCPGRSGCAGSARFAELVTYAPS